MIMRINTINELENVHCVVDMRASCFRSSDFSNKKKTTTFILHGMRCIYIRKFDLFLLVNHNVPFIWVTRVPVETRVISHCEFLNQQHLPRSIDHRCALKSIPYIFTDLRYIT